MADLVSRDSFYHVLLIDDEQEEVQSSQKVAHAQNAELSSDNSVDLGAALLVDAAIHVLLIFDKHIDIAFPDPGDLNLGAFQLGSVITEGVVLGSAAIAHELVL